MIFGSNESNEFSPESPQLALYEFDDLSGSSGSCTVLDRPEPAFDDVGTAFDVIGPDLWALDDYFRPALTWGPPAPTWGPATPTPTATPSPTPTPTANPAITRMDRRQARRRRRRRQLRRVAIGAVVGVVSAVCISFAPAWSSTPSEPKPTLSPGAPGIVAVPIRDFDQPDPMMVTAGTAYHVYFSTAFDDLSTANVPEIVGGPGHWGPEIDALPVLPAWALSAKHGGKVWAPYVENLHGSWLMYYSAALNRPGPPSWAAGPIHCLGVARSSNASGPFVPVGNAPVVCQSAAGGDIDVQPFDDPHGPGGSRHPWYLIWKSDNNNLIPPRPTIIWSAPLSNNGLTLAGTPTVLYRAEQRWQRPVMEAPQMVHSPLGGDWLFLSGGTGFGFSRYAMGAARCDGPMGPCHAYGTRPLVSTNRQGAGPGEETIFVAPDRSYWLLYNPWHPITPFMLLRPTEAVRIGWNRAGPYVAEAGMFPSPPKTDQTAVKHRAHPLIRR